MRSVYEESGWLCLSQQNNIQSKIMTTTANDSLQAHLMEGINWPFAGSMKLTKLLMFLPKYPKKILFNMNKTNETFILLQIMTAMFYQLFITTRKTQCPLTKPNFSKTLKINSKNSVYK